MTRALSAIVVLCCLAACGVLDPHHSPNLSGTYSLSLVDGSRVPCCAHTDTLTGVTTTPLGGRLTLGDASPETFVATPAGVYLPSSCVYTVPNGAHVHGDTVFTSDGNWYLEAPCGKGTYALTLTTRVDSAGDTDTIQMNASGRYSWSQSDSAVDLVGSLSGYFTGGASGRQMVLEQAHVGFEPQQYEPQYTFAGGN